MIGAPRTIIRNNETLLQVLFWDFDEEVINHSQMSYSLSSLNKRTSWDDKETNQENYGENHKSQMKELAKRLVLKFGI